MKNRKISVLLVEDNLIFGEYLYGIISETQGLEVVGVCQNLRDAKVMLADPSIPIDLLVLDIYLPDGSGLVLLSHELVLSKKIKVVLISGRCDEYILLLSARGSIVGFISKVTTRWSDWRDAFRKLKNTETYFSPEILPKLMNIISDRNHWSKLLSNREHELLPCFADGDSNEILETRFSLSSATIQAHRKRIMRKIGVNSTRELMIWARTKGFQSQSEPS